MSGGAAAAADRYLTLENLKRLLMKKLMLKLRLKMLLV
jgi:hypothetical protein